ncbi:norsolorinic acid reductase [Myriangium duriaei CBS 260.36]|uniref:Norsolorinic acid reductase n=1 Tax=Myriangium duriaei CBS 260.36 TaxID=1168546 RepID=A0A9P4J4T8_9PEZI|nr:norsolorinic acid reductase [Myriangium duriaei CBS 260.36]
MSLFAPAEAPKSVLGYHRILSSTGGVRVSPLSLGCMNFGDAWASYMGKCDKDQSFKILDYFYENGGNFLDTSNNYQNEESETWIGEWMEKRGNRDQLVIATKYTTAYPSLSDPKALKSNYQGNHTKSMHMSIRASLKKLKTDYIDILYLHWWDFSTSIEEVMQSLNVLVSQGLVLYLGISDAPAWIVSKANQYARDHGLRQFVVYQGKWSAGDRDFERDILPMAQAEGMALAPWSALGGGKFKTKESREAKDGRQVEHTEKDIKISEALEKVAKKKGTLITSVALAYVMHKSPNVFPIVGGRNTDHLKGNIEALKLKLTEEDIKEIEDAYPFDHGFPTTMLFHGEKSLKTSDIFLVKANAHLDILPNRGIIQPRSE